MSKKFLIPFAILFALGAPSFALAGAASRERAQNRKIMFDYAKCVVKERRDRAAEAILSDSDNDAILKKYSDLIRGNCLDSAVGGGAQMKFGGDFYRYALADALVNSDFSKSAESDFSNRLPLAHIALPSQSELDAVLGKITSKKKREAAQIEFNQRLGVAWLSRFGECVVRHNPVKARLWLLTPTAIPEETSRINDLREDFNACLAQGTMSFNRESMRGTVALNYYRLAKATPQPVAGKSN